MMILVFCFQYQKGSLWCFEERKVHNMLSLMLNLRFKSFHLISSFIGYGKSVSIVEEYNKQSLYLMFLKCYHHLHLMT
jgi:hypothetical protein